MRFRSARRRNTRCNCDHRSPRMGTTCARCRGSCLDKRSTHARLFGRHTTTTPVLVSPHRKSSQSRTRRSASSLGTRSRASSRSVLWWMKDFFSSWRTRHSSVHRVAQPKRTAHKARCRTWFLSPNRSRSCTNHPSSRAAEGNGHRARFAAHPGAYFDDRWWPVASTFRCFARARFAGRGRCDEFIVQAKHFCRCRLGTRERRGSVRTNPRGHGDLRPVSRELAFGFFRAFTIGTRRLVVSMNPSPEKLPLH